MYLYDGEKHIELFDTLIVAGDSSASHGILIVKCDRKINLFG